MNAWHALKIIGAVIALSASFCPAFSQTTSSTDVCMGNGGGTSCQSATTVNYTCPDYKAIGGGGPQTYEELRKRFCSVIDASGNSKQVPANISVTQNNGGGECGWTKFHIVCVYGQ